MHCLLPVLVITLSSYISQSSCQSAAHREDSLCAAEKCPPSKTCRVIHVCGVIDKTNCRLQARCLTQAEVPEFSHTGVCQIGQPILVYRENILGDTYCGTHLPCPEGTFCNTELMDTYSTCCRSDPDKPVREGVCPVGSNTDRFFCVDTCANDGDCRHVDKCCQNGCRKECTPPQPPPPPAQPVATDLFRKLQAMAASSGDPCANKICMDNYYCVKPGTPCTNTGLFGQQPCPTPGQCAACPNVFCYMWCHYGNEEDANGCKLCKCKPPPGVPAVVDVMPPLVPETLGAPTEEQKPNTEQIFYNLQQSQPQQNQPQQSQPQQSQPQQQNNQQNSQQSSQQQPQSTSENTPQGTQQQPQQQQQQVEQQQNQQKQQQQEPKKTDTRRYMRRDSNPWGMNNNFWNWLFMGSLF